MVSKALPARWVLCAVSMVLDGGHVLCAGMAAAPAPEGTTFAWAAGLRIPGGRLVRPLLTPILEHTLRRLEDYARDMTTPK